MREQVAFIHEDICIGCTKCIDVCPTDAIIGAKNMAHTVVTDLCIGCDLCLPPCPVNCIDILPVTRDDAKRKTAAREAKTRIQARLARLKKEAAEQTLLASQLIQKTPEDRKADIAAALRRARGSHET
jgi:electron transport complex protein RnfB